MNIFSIVITWIVYVALYLVSIHVPSIVKANLAYHIFGDPTPKVNNRMIWWNPLPNLDIIGTISILFLYVSWPKPMDISWNELSQKKSANTYIELADCFTSLVLGIIACLLHIIFSKLQLALNLDLRFLMSLIDMFASFNIFLFFLKLLPLPQLPGFRILTGLFYHKPQGVFNSLSLTLMGTVILIILFIWTPLPQLLGNLTSWILKPFAVSGSSYLQWLDKIPGIGGL